MLMNDQPEYACPHCHAPAKAGDVICPQCGKSYYDQAQSPVVPQNQPDPMAPSPFGPVAMPNPYQQQQNPYQQPSPQQPNSYQQQQNPYLQPNPYQQMGQIMQGQQTNALAVISLISSMFWLCWIGSVVGIICGIIARKQIKESNGSQTGSGLALAGLIIGAIGVVFLVGSIILELIPKTNLLVSKVVSFRPWEAAIWDCHADVSGVLGMSSSHLWLFVIVNL